MSIFLDISRYKCPNCQLLIEVNLIQDFSKRFAKREPFNCPHCATQLNWARGSHNLAHYSMWAAFLSFSLPFTGLYAFNIGTYVMLFFFMASGVGMILKELVIEEDGSE